MTAREPEKQVTRRRVPFWLIMVMIFVGSVTAVALFYLLRPLEGPVPEGVLEHYIGFEQGYTEQGFPRLGSADAPVVIEEFSSFACPHCREFHEEQFADLLDEIAAGQVQFILISVPHIGAGAKNAAKGALCAGEQGRFWEMADVLFDWQDRYLTSVFAERRIKLGAKNLGLDTAAFDECMDRDQPVIDRARDEFHTRGLTGTPSLFLNGERVRDYAELENLQEAGG